MTPTLRKWLFETLYKNRYLYRFASTVPFAGQWRVWQQLVLSRIQGKQVLEFGCGLGDLLADMLEAGYDCHAIEKSPQMVAAARDTLRRRHIGQPNCIQQGIVQQLPFPDNTFDTIVSTFPSEYIYDSATLAEAARVLRPGGRLIVIEGASLLPIGFLQSTLVAIQSLVYGPAALFGPRKQNTLQEKGKDSRETAPEAVITEVVPETWSGMHIPLAKHHFIHRSERVHSPRWEVYITIGENP